jgi:hypothetical protein
MWEEGRKKHVYEMSLIFCDDLVNTAARVPTNAGPSDTNEQMLPNVFLPC